MTEDEVKSSDQGRRAKQPSLGSMSPEEVEKLVDSELDPYIAHMREGFGRALRLARAASAVLFHTGLEIQSPKETHDDIFRSIVVLTHAYLEDFLRTIGKSLLPYAPESVLNSVPLTGLTDSGRPEQFFLGKLIHHKHKSVNTIIIDSIEEHLGRQSFNNVTDIVSFLRLLDLEMRTPELLPKLEAMILRRHQIVHRGDRVGGQIQPIDKEQVLAWADMIQKFQQDVIKQVLKKSLTRKYANS